MGGHGVEPGKPAFPDLLQPATLVESHDEMWPPRVEVLAALTEKVRRRVVRWFRMQRLLDGDAAADMLARENSGFSVAASVQCMGESEAEDAALEIAAEFLLYVSGHRPLGMVSPLEPALEVLGHDLVERCLLWATPLATP